MSEASDRARAVGNRPDVRAKLSRSVTAAWADPEKRARMAAPRVRFDADMDKTIRIMLKEGHSRTQIADRVGVSFKTLMRRIEEMSSNGDIPNNIAV